MPVNPMEDLITRVLSGEASDAERRSVERWRRECAEHERSFQELLHTWRLAALHDSQQPIPAPPSVERIVEAATRRREYATPLTTPSRRGHVWRWTAAAAVLLAAAGLGTLALLRTTAPIAQTGPEESRTITLADGSIVRLGPDSQLRASGDDSRTVRLDGVAFFGVATDTSHPFAVETRAGRAEALGTRFEIRAGADSLRLLVVEGRVGLAAAGRRVEARAGELSRITGEAPSQPEDVDVWQLLDWPQGLLIFQATPLRRALQEVAAQFGTEVVITDSTLARRTVTAWFENETMDEIVATICQAVGASCTVGSTIEVAP
jgi:transmembrane sensor